MIDSSATIKGTVLSATLMALLMMGGAQANAQTVVIQNVTLRSAGGAVQDRSVILRNGKVGAIGRNLKIPQNATVVDGTGKVLTAGLIATASRLGLIEISMVDYTSEGSFGSAFPVHAAYSVVDGYNPASMLIDVARNGGITSTISAPRGGLIAGQSAWFTMGRGNTAGNLVKSNIAMHGTLGRRVSSIGNGSRGHALQKLRALFEDALHYDKNRVAFHRGQTRKYGAGHLELEGVLQVLQRKIPLVLRVDRKSDIEAVLGLAKQYRIRLVLHGATEAWMLGPQLAAADIAVIVDPKANLPKSFDEVQVVDDLATRLVKAGVSVIISPSEDASSARVLRQLAGLSVAHGLRWEQAFAAITTTPAKVFGVNRGTIKVGAAADVVLWTGDPLELSSRAERIFIGGVEQSLDNHQTQLRDRYK